MRNSDYQLKIHRGSTPRHEMRQGLNTHPGDRLAAIPAEMMGSNVRSVVERLLPPGRLPEVH